MKTGILTFPNSTSYGAELQMYALYNTVNKLGFDAEVINYQNSYMRAEKHVKITKSTDKIKKVFGDLLHVNLKCKFKGFEKEYLRSYPEKPFQDKSKLVELNERYDAVICGSDQVWNPDITGSDMSYFLDFCKEETRRISYAPSFGVEEFSTEFSAKIKEQLEQFSAVSIRESQGKRYLDCLLNEDVPLVLDPTLLMDSKEWEQLEKKHRVKSDYILLYTIRNTKTLMDFCVKLSRKTGYKIVVVGGNLVKSLCNKNKNIKYAFDISPNEWLYLVHNAKYVVTNSFHGTAFSINYRKDFFVEFSSYTNSRLEHILSKFALESRKVENVDFNKIVPVDYAKTDQLLPELREKSIDFLRNALTF